MRKDKRTNGFDEVFVVGVDVESWKSTSRGVGWDETDVRKSTEKIAPKSGDVSNAGGGEEVLRMRGLKRKGRKR